MSKKLQEHIDDLNEFIAKAQSVVKQYPGVEIDPSSLTFKLEGLELVACDHMSALVLRETACVQVNKKLAPDVTLFRKIKADGVPVQAILDYLQEECPETYKQVLEAARVIQQRQDDQYQEYLKKGPLATLLGLATDGQDEEGDHNCGNPFCPIHGAGTFRDEKPKEPSKVN